MWEQLNTICSRSISQGWPRQWSMPVPLLPGKTVGRITCWPMWLKAKSYTNPAKGWKLLDLWSSSMRSRRVSPAGLRCSSVCLLSAVITLLNPWESGFCLPAFPQAAQYLSVPKLGDEPTVYHLCLPCNSHLPGESEKFPTNRVHYLGPFLDG